MATSRAHLTALPRGFIVVRILQFLFTIAILGLLIFMIIEDAKYPQFIVLITVRPDANLKSNPQTQH